MQRRANLCPDRGDDQRPLRGCGERESVSSQQPISAAPGRSAGHDHHNIRRRHVRHECRQHRSDECVVGHTGVSGDLTRLRRCGLSLDHVHSFDVRIEHRGGGSGDGDYARRYPRTVDRSNDASPRQRPGSHHTVSMRVAHPSSAILLLGRSRRQGQRSFASGEQGRAICGAQHDACSS